MSGRTDRSLASLVDDAPVETERLRFNPQFYPNTVADYVLVWMQKAQRSRDNPALDLGFHLANALKLPLLVLFTLVDYPGARTLHYRFMLEGLRECAADLRSRGAAFCIDAGDMKSTVTAYARLAAILIADEGKLAIERRWREDIAAEPGLPPLILVETESVVPPFAASNHLEWSAATLRGKISAKMPFFLGLPKSVPECHVAARTADFPSRDKLLEQPVRPRNSPNDSLLILQKLYFTPGHEAGMARFREFIESGGLECYDKDRNNPCIRGQSDMSPYLHFGQVSPVALAKLALGHSLPAAQSYLEQLVVRRELALNYVLFNPGYDRFESAAPEWAIKNLAAREDRKALYSLAELEAGQTEDLFWNAAQKELLLTGKMHNYMRMYWGKQVVSWFPDSAKAFDILVHLNDNCSLDGRDPNGYTGIAWCFGRHDRPWPMRPLFGNVRSMVASGLRRKFDVERYASEVEDLYTTRIKEEI
jgi:deoxyribodipyrimidine photo-lyase